MSAAERMPLDTAPFQCLGYDRDVYYYLPKATGQITSLTIFQHKALRLLRLAPLEWWRDAFPKGGKDVNWLKAIDAMYRASEKAGIYVAEELRP